MRLTFQSITIPRLVAVAVAAVVWLVCAAGAHALTLYDGSYAADISSSTPSGLSPESDVTIEYPTSNLRLAWHQVPGADKYQLQIARQSFDDADCSESSAFQLANIVITTTTDQNEWVPTLADAANGAEIWTGTYCWRVRTTGKGYGAWSSSNRFTRTWTSELTGLRFYNDHDGPIPRTEEDADYETGSTTTRNSGYLSWDELPGASEYEVHVATSQSFSTSSIIARRDGLTAARVLLLHLPDDTYYWRVRGVTPNGTEGAWSAGSNAFTVQWQDTTWSDPAKIVPADSSVQSDLKIGWTPMPGASHYEYQIGTNAGCFWDPSNTLAAPKPYGDWVNKPAVYDTNAVFQYTQDPLMSQCRLSALGATTINNFVTLQDVISPEVDTNMANDCLNSDGTVACERASFPDNVPDDRPAVPWRGAAMAAGREDGAAYSIYWRVRPVYTLNQASETGWTIASPVSVYGSWTKYRQGGANREFRFDVDPASAVADSIDTRCDSPGLNPTTNQCLVHVGATMQADEPVGSGDSGSMQAPMLTWSPFPGAGGYIIQVARDPLFNNMERTVYAPRLQSISNGFQQSWAPSNGFVDNSEGSGYWWRVLPCKSEIEDVTTDTLTNCLPFYSDDASGLPTSIDANGYDDMAVAQTFTKQSIMATAESEGFEGATPLIKWAAEGTDESDYVGWSRGIAGAQHYEVQLARDPFMTKGVIDYATTIPRIAPYQPNGSSGKGSELAEGIWYYRVRAVDRDGIEGSWSNISSFNKRIEAPNVEVSGGGPTSGAGVVVMWDAVQGAGTYEIQWSPDSGFESGVSSASTLQTMYRIPDTKLGTFYWRVRAVRNGVAGQWSEIEQSVKIVGPTTLRYALNRPFTPAGTKVQVTGELRVAGSAANGKTVRLQRKNGGCDAVDGAYIDASQAVTGVRNDDGLVTFPTKVTQNTCLRLAWVTDSSVKYSAPIPIKVTPVTSVKLNTTKVRRGASFCMTLRSNVALSGRLRVQYRKGKGAWQTTRAVMLRRAKTKVQCAAISKAGNYQIRVYLDSLTHPAGWVQYESVVKGAGTVKVNDVWSIRR